MADLPPGALPPVGAADDTTSAKPAPRVRPIRLNQQQGTNYRPADWISKGIGLLPVAGNITGDVLGGIGAAAAIPETMGGSAILAPAAVAAAGGVGQAAGRAGQLALLQALGYAPPADMNKAGTAADLAGQAGWGAAASLGGRALPWMARSAAKGLMGQSLRTGEKLATETALAEGIRPGTSVLTGKTGTEQVGQRIGSLSSEVDKILSDAQKQGVSFKIADVLPRAKAAIAAARKIDPSRAAEMEKVLDDFMQPYMPVRNAAGRVLKIPGAKLTPAELQEMKQSADQIARPLHKAIESGQYPGMRAEARATIYKAIADDARATLENQIPAVGPINERLSPIIGDLRPVMTRAENIMTGPVFGAAGRGLVVQPLNMIPQGAAGQIALGANSPMFQAGAQYIPRILAAMLLNQRINPNTQGGVNP